MLTNDEAGSGGNGYDPSFHVLEIAGNAIVGGMEKYVYNLVQHLPNQGFKVTCVTPFHSAFTSSLRQLGSEVYITIMDNDPYWRSIQFVTQLVRYQHIDLIHAHMPRAHVLAGIVGSLTGVPVVATVHGMEITNQELAICRTTGSHLTVVCQEAYSQGLALGLPRPDDAHSKRRRPNSVQHQPDRSQFPEGITHISRCNPGRFCWQAGLGEGTGYICPDG